MHPRRHDRLPTPSRLGLSPSAPPRNACPRSRPRDARLHRSPANRIVLAAATLWVAGCHTAGPLQRMVQVSNRPSEDLAEINPPPQRLTTSQPRGREEPLTSAQPSELESKGGSTGKRIEASLAALGAADAPVPRSGTEPATPDQRATRPELASAVLPAVEQAELIDAFSSSPPEVQELALRQLIAIATRTAHQTSQPSGIEDSLTQALKQSAAAGPLIASINDGDSPAVAETTRGPGEHLVTRAAGTQAEIDEAGPAPPPVQTVSAISVGDLSDLAVAPAGGADSPAANSSVSTGGSIPMRSVSDLVVSPSRPAGSESRPAGSESRPTGSESRSADPVLLDDASSYSDQQLFELLVTRLSRPAKDEGEADRSRRAIMARHVMVMAGKPDQAVLEMDGFSEEEQEYLRHQLLALWTIIDPGGHPVPGRRFSTALPQLREATKFLAASTDALDVRSLAFCTEVEAYGQIKEFSRSRFKPGQQVLLYCEIDNFTSRQLSEGFETHLRGSYSVYNESNQKVYSQLLPADKQISRNYLRDYFIVYEMYLPKQLADGSYRLELTMEDVGGKKYGQSSIPFEIRD